MKRIKFDILRKHGIEVMLLPTMGVKVVDGYLRRNIYFCFAWLCFGVSILLITKEWGDTE